MRVTLLSYTKDAERLCASAAHSCYSNKGAGELMEEWDEDKGKRWLGSPLSSGHHSVIEHASYTFSSRAYLEVFHINWSDTVWRLTLNFRSAT